MATYMYKNISIETGNITNRLDASVGGQIVTQNRGDLVTQNDAGTTVPFPLGLDGYVLTVDTDPLNPTGLAWRSTASGITAGDGLEFTGTTLNVVLDPAGGLTFNGDAIAANVAASTTIMVDGTNELEVRSSAVAGQTLLSAGTTTTPATWGALDIANANSVTGILALNNGGTGADLLGVGTPGQVIIQGATAFEVSTIAADEIVTLTGTQTLTNKTINDSTMNDSTINTTTINTSTLVDPNIVDVNGATLLDFPDPAIAGAINYLVIENATPGNGPTITAATSVDDQDIDINIVPAGSGNVVLSGLSYPNTDGTVGQVLTTDGAGNLSFQDLPPQPQYVTFPSNTGDVSYSLGPTIDGSAHFIDVHAIANIDGTSAASFITRATGINVGGVTSIIALEQIYAPSNLIGIEVTITAQANTFVINLLNSTPSSIAWRLKIEDLSV